MTSPEQPDDQRDALFIADFHPGLGARLARQHAHGYDAPAGRARFLLWLAAHADDGDEPLQDYLARVTRLPRLSAEEETGLAARIAAGRLAESRLAEGRGTLTTEARASLERIVQDGSQSVTRLLEANLWLVTSAAERFTGRGMPFADLVQEGNLGLVRAIQQYDHTKGYRFAPFATWWIRQAITRAVAGRLRLPRVPVQALETGGIDELALAERRMHEAVGREPTPEELAADLDLPAPATSRSPERPGPGF